MAESMPPPFAGYPRKPAKTFRFVVRQSKPEPPRHVRFVVDLDAVDE